MSLRMLIDATQPEETRVVIHKEGCIEDFDYEVGARKQLKGNIYLAKVTRVEPSLQAAFVEYGGNRHGFLPFSEIHPDYYRIPIADREALVESEGAALNEAEAQEEAAENASESDEQAAIAAASEAPVKRSRGRRGRDRKAEAEPAQDSAEEAPSAEDGEAGPLQSKEEGPAALDAGDEANLPEVQEVEVEEKVDSVGGDEVEEAERRRAKLLRRYKIQEVIKRRQILLVQVTKEERGNKGAALTTYVSLAGRYCVLMPNTNKGGGISRKISNTNDRRRLKVVLGELEIPKGIAVIVRTAGSQRSKAEIRRDYEYLMRLWNDIRETTFSSTAPALIHEEANLIKRAIRDLYTRDMEEILVEGEESYKAAKAFMKSLMPSHAKKVQLYKDDSAPLYQRYQVERQLDAMHSPVVHLRSGGYIVLNPTEALVAIDINSGKATRERNIEETALRTNLEAAEEIGRQLRLRDLAGLVVIDFIDMEESRNNREVERRLKEALRDDRARIQLGRISSFGLLEMSRQRLRPSIFESSTSACPHCRGSGFVRTTESSALQILRLVEEEAIRRGGGEFRVELPIDVAFYLLNSKRGQLYQIEQRQGITVDVHPNADLAAGEAEVTCDDERVQIASQTGGEQEEGGDGRRRRRRSRRRDGGRDDERDASRGGARRRPAEDGAAAETAEPGGESEEESAAAGEQADESEEDRSRKRRRRGKRGGRRRSRRGAATETTDAEATSGEETEAATPGFGPQPEIGLTPADGADDDTALEEEKPKRRTRRRKPKAEEAEEGAADSTVTGAAIEGAAVAEETLEEAPKPPRKRAPRQRRAKAAVETAAVETDAVETAAVETAAVEPAAVETGAVETGEVESPQADAAREVPITLVEPAEEPPASSEAEEELEASAVELAADSAAESDDGGTSEGAAPAPVEPQEELAAAPVEAPEPLGEPEPAPAQPKRRGWWNRG